MEANNGDSNGNGNRNENQNDNNDVVINIEKFEKNKDKNFNLINTQIKHSGNKNIIIHIKNSTLTNAALINQLIKVLKQFNNKIDLVFYIDTIYSMSILENDIEAPHELLNNIIFVFYYINIDKKIFELCKIFKNTNKKIFLLKNNKSEFEYLFTNFSDCNNVTIFMNTLPIVESEKINLFLSNNNFIVITITEIDEKTVVFYRFINYFNQYINNHKIKIIKKDGNEYKLPFSNSTFNNNELEILYNRFMKYYKNSLINKYKSYENSTALKNKNNNLKRNATNKATNEAKNDKHERKMMVNDGKMTLFNQKTKMGS